MDPNAVIESYVDEVVRRLPARQSKDVGLELRDLLTEELANRSAEAGRPADEAMALGLLKSFGAPGEVADRYLPAGPTIIRGQDARMFAIVAFSGVGAQWALTLLQAVVLPTEGDVWIRLAHWWPSMGLGAFWWPGIMVTGAIVAAYVRDRWPRSEPGPRDAHAGRAHLRWTPAARLDPDRVNRPLWAVALFFLAIGMLLVAATPVLVEALPDPPRAAFTLDEGFVRVRGPFILLLWALQLSLYLVVLFQGRWRAFSRRADLALKTGGVGVVAWIIFGGPMLAMPEVDAFAKVILAATTVVFVIEVVVKLRREQMRVGRADRPATK
jgi:hypothetical protein